MLVFIHLDVFQIQKSFWCRSVTNLTPSVPFCESFWWYEPILLMLITGLTDAIFIYSLPTMSKVYYLSAFIEVLSHLLTETCTTSISAGIKQHSKLPKCGGQSTDVQKSHPTHLKLCRGSKGTSVAQTPVIRSGRFPIQGRKKWIWGCQTVLVSCGF